MVVQAGVVERLLDSDPERARAAVSQISRTGRTSLEEMRQVLGRLREGDPARDTGAREPTPGLAGLPALVSRVEDAGMPVALVVQGVVRPLPPTLDLAAYRVVQEALTNCLKHARSGRADVRIRYAAAGLEVEVQDDERGAAAPSSAGQGLVGMRERVAVHGGELVTGSTASGGFRVRASFPAAAGADPPAPGAAS